jgi:hypothetical protein
VRSPLSILALLLIGCASTQPAVRPPLSGERAAPPPLAGGADAIPDAPPVEADADGGTGAAPAGVDPVIGLVGGRPVLASELLESWLQRDSIGLKSAYNVIVSGRLAQLEATRLGLRIPPALVAEATAANLDRLARSLVGPDADGEALDGFLRERMDLDPTRYRDRMRADTIRELITERTVRAWTLSNEYARVRLLVLEDSPEVERALADLGAGADFVQLIRSRGLDADGMVDGLVPFMLRNERAPLSRLAFETPVGQVGGPIELAEAQVLLLVEARPDPLAGDWDAVGLAVEGSLLDDPVSDEEWLAWQVAMDRRWGIDVAPLYDFLNEPFR